MNSIAVFARWPRMGTVKTRLTPALPAALSLALHRAMLADTLAVARATAAERRILYWGDAPDAVDAGVDPAADPPQTTKDTNGTAHGNGVAELAPSGENEDDPEEGSYSGS